jgi:hypothetical protein
VRYRTVAYTAVGKGGIRVDGDLHDHDQSDEGERLKRISAFCFLLSIFRMRIPFYKPSIGEKEINEVVPTLRSGWLTTGPKVKQFEKEFAEYLGHKHAVAVNSCTAALHLALEAIGLKAGQGVVVPTMTFAATAEVVRYFAARPILVDCRTEDFNLDVAHAERRIEWALGQGIEVKAILPMHYGGQIGDVAGVQALARRHHLKIIEDAAHCCPAYYRDHGTTDYKTTERGAESRKQKVEINSKGAKARNGEQKAGIAGVSGPVASACGPLVPESLSPWPCSQWSVVSCWLHRRHQLLLLLRQKGYVFDDSTPSG